MLDKFSLIEMLDEEDKNDGDTNQVLRARRIQKLMSKVNKQGRKPGDYDRYMEESYQQIAEWKNMVATNTDEDGLPLSMADRKKT